MGQGTVSLHYLFGGHVKVHRRVARLAVIRIDGPAEAGHGPALADVAVRKGNARRL